MLENGPGGLELRARHRADFGPVRIDWSSAGIQRRIKAGRRQLLARAVGLHRRSGLQLLDATGGLGRDAFVLAALGAQVTLCERNETLQALLQDAHRQALADPNLSEAARRIEVCNCDARELLGRGWDVVYLDPMYPHTGKTALAKKELQLLRELTGGDPDAEELPALALPHARHVVVKRPLKAATLGGQPAAHTLKGSQARFDVYVGTKTKQE